MNLSFLNPLFLFGLSAGIIPVLIHRLTKREAHVRKFSAVRLLIQSQKVMARPQRLKHLLLLALRVLAVVSLVFLMARPVVTSPGFLARENEETRIILFDNSLSMGYREDAGERFALAKGAAKEMIEGAKGKILIIPTSPFQGQTIQRNELRWESPEEALRELDRLSLSFGRGDPTEALGLAYHQLKELKASGEILVLTDMTRGDWEGLNPSQMETLSGETAITFIRIGGPNRDPNIAVKEVNIMEGEAVVGVPLRLVVTVANRSDQSGSTLVQLLLSGVKKDQKSVVLNAGEEGRVYLDVSFEKAGWVNGEVRLSGDRLPYDDIFYFPLQIRDKVKVLVVDGDPRTSLRAGESYYLVNALHPGEAEGSPFLTRVITETEFVGHDLRPYDAVFLLNVAKPQPSKLTPVLNSGRPVFIFLGDRVIPEEYNRIPLFPWRIREIRDRGASKPETIGQIDTSHESLKLFSGPTGGESLRKSSFNRYFKVEGSSKNLLTFGNKDPLLSEGDLGNGRIFLFTSSADLDWNDLPLKAAYLPLIQGLLKEAVGLNKESSKKIRIGEPFGERGSPIQLIGPEGGPGIYQFSLPSGEVRYGVNPPLEESDLGKVAPEEMRKKFGMIEVKVVEYKEGMMRNVQGRKKDLWPLCLAFLLMVLGVEMAIANGIAPAWRRPVVSSSERLG